VKKEQAVLGGKFDKNNYKEERVWATATDGTKIPISIVYQKRNKERRKQSIIAICLWFIWNSMEPGFDSTILSLLDRGFIYAIAHIRGGEDLGRQWYEDGKLLKKKNTLYGFY
jgi:oligopeptidase B